MRRRVSRRQFLAGGAAVGASAAAGVAAHDVLATREGSGGVLPRPAWVRTIDHPKLALDEATYARFDKRQTVFFSSSGGSFAKYAGKEHEQVIQRASQNAGRDPVLSRRPGFQPRDRALSAAAGIVSRAQGGPNAPNRDLLSWTPILASASDPSPAQDWADPRRATADVKVATRFFGASLVGVCKLDPRHVYSHDLDGKAIVFEEVTQPYETDDRRVIPTRCQWAVVYAVRMSGETVKRAPAVLATAAANLAYSELTRIAASLAEFIRYGGFVAIPTVNDTALSIPLAVEAGLGELARHNRLITPEYGPMVRLGKVITDLPLQPDRPIDAGIAEFCETCAKCAEACPATALSFREKPSMSVQGAWSNPGHTAWFEDSVKCYSYSNSLGTSCMICFSVCPYAKKSRAAAHRLVKATVSRTRLANGLLRSIDDAFGYGGQKNADAWWRLDLPPFGWDE